MKINFCKKLKAWRADYKGVSVYAPTVGECIVLHIKAMEVLK